MKCETGRDEQLRICIAGEAAAAQLWREGEAGQFHQVTAYVLEWCLIAGSREGSDDVR
jgi:hypothetical protein